MYFYSQSFTLNFYTKSTKWSFCILACAVCVWASIFESCHCKGLPVLSSTLTMAKNHLSRLRRDKTRKITGVRLNIRFHSTERFIWVLFRLRVGQKQQCRADIAESKQALNAVLQSCSKLLLAQDKLLNSFGGMWCHLKVMRVIFYNHPLPAIDSLSGRTKGFGEEGEQLVSLVWKKEKQKQPLYDPCSLKWSRGCERKPYIGLHGPGTCRLSLLMWFIGHNSRCCYGWRGRRHQGWWGGVQGLVLHLKGWTVLHAFLVHHLFSRGSYTGK